MQLSENIYFIFSFCETFYEI